MGPGYINDAYPALLASGLVTKPIAPGANPITVAMYPLIVDTSFTGAEGSVQTANGNGAVRGGGGTGNDDPG